MTTAFTNLGTSTNFGTVAIGTTFLNYGTFTNRCHGTVNITPTSGSGTFTTDPTCPAVGAVGGVVTTVNVFSILAPWIAVLGLVACVGTAVVFVKPWKKPEN
jgi:hypothetical protein